MGATKKDEQNPAVKSAANLAPISIGSDDMLSFFGLRVIELSDAGVSPTSIDARFSLCCF
jgi:hypothetical protein